MKKIIKKSMLVVLCIIFSFGTFACNKNKTGDTGLDVDEFMPSVLEKAVDENTGGVLTLTSKGGSAYKIVISDSATLVEQEAASNLKNYLKLATSAALEIISDNGIIYNTKNYYISIGKTSLLASSGINTAIDVLGHEGMSINTKGNLILLAGATDDGTLYSIYEFLNKQIGFEVYYTDEIYYNTVKEVPVYKYNGYVSVPDIEGRWIGCGMFSDAKESALMRLQYGYTDGSITINGNQWGLWSHSLTFQLGLTPENHPNHSEWFSGNQICMTQDSLIDYIVELLKSRIKNNPIARYWQLGGSDDHHSCQCDGCKASNSINGGSGGTYVIFLNKIAEKIAAWKETEGIERETMIVGLAYQGYAQDPGFYNEATGKYEPVNENVKTRNDVGMMYAPINSCHSHSYGDPECKVNDPLLNDEFYGWAACTDNLMLWLYNTDFYNYFLSFNDWGSIKGNAEIFKETGVKFIFSQSCKNGRTSFDALRLYLRSKLWWDNSLNYYTLFNDFFSSYYKSAESVMKEYFNAIQSNYIKIYDDYNTGGCIGYNKIGAEYYSADKWDYSLLMNHKAIISRAYAAVDASAEPESIKEKLRTRILVEEINIDAFLVYNCEAYFTPEEYALKKAKFYSDCKTLGIEYMSEISLV